MSKSEIILSWLFEQVSARNIRPAEGARLAGFVDMSDATELADDIKRHLESANDFRYVMVGAKRDNSGISPLYDAAIMSEAIRKKLCQTDKPGPTVLAWYAVALIKTGIFESGIKQAQVRRLLLDMDRNGQNAWGSRSAFNTAFFNTKADMSEEERIYFVSPILEEYSRLKNETR